MEHDICSSHDVISHMKSGSDLLLYHGNYQLSVSLPDHVMSFRFLSWDIESSRTTQLAILTGVLFIVFAIYRQGCIYRRRRALKMLHDCKDASIYPTYEPFAGMDFSLTMKRVFDDGSFFWFFKNNFQTYGSTFFVNSLWQPTMFTNDPENVKAILTTKVQDWPVAEARSALSELLGQGLINVDGQAWNHTRSALRPIFVKDNMSDIDKLEEHMQALLKNIATDGSTIDLKPLFINYTLDTSTDLLFGESTNSLSREMDPDQDRFARSLHLALEEAFLVGNAGPAAVLFRTKAGSKAREVCKKHVSKYVHAALAQVESEKRGGDGPAKYNFLVEFARTTNDETVLRDNALTMLFAGQDTTACALANLWFQLARHPKVYAKLAAEVAALNGQIPSYEWLKNNTYLRWCVYESMRTIPVTPFKPPRQSNKDTILPRGGGKDGKSPLFVPKNTRVVESLWHTSTRKDLWGGDAEEFRPERWDGRLHGWNFTPFGGGPRICIGQQFALVETYFVTVRLMQKFSRCENRDPVHVYVPDVTGPMAPKNGVKVALFER